MFVSKGKRTDTRTSVRFHGGAMNPLVKLAPAIDWNFLLAIDISNPLRPRYFLSGKHDGFPAYEIYLKTVKDGRPKLDAITTVYQWKAPLDQGVGSLVDPLFLFGENVKRRGNIK